LSKKHSFLSFYKDVTEIKEYDTMLDEYYVDRGWELETGIPTVEKLKALKLEDEIGKE